MQFLDWDDYLKTGVEIVDQQHKGLVDMANDTSARLASAEGLSQTEMHKVLGYLVEYAEIHFGTEEALMALAGVDERHAERHRQTHIHFLAQVQDMMHDLGQGGLPGRQLMDFLGNWLIYHMLGEDAAMGRQLRAISGGTPPDDAWQQEADRPVDPALAAANRSLAKLYGFMTRRNEQLVAKDREQRSSQQQLTELVAERTAELGASEERFRALFTSGTLPVLIVRLDQSLLPAVIAEANPVACEMLGYAHGELRARPFCDIVAEEERARFPSLMSELLATGRFVSDMSLVSKAGDRISGRIHMIHLVMRGQLAIMLILQDLSSGRDRTHSLAEQEEVHLARVRSEFLASLGRDVDLPRQGVLGLVQPGQGGAIGPAQATAFLTRLPLFQDVSLEVLAPVAAASREKRLGRGEMLFQKGDRPRALYLVIAGQVKLAISSPQGNEKVLDIFGPQSTFGEAEVFMSKPYPYFAQALTEAHVLQISQQELLDLLEKDVGFSRRLVSHLGVRLHDLVQDLESYTLRTGTERVIGYLLQHAYIESDGRMAVELPARKQVIASLLHLTPETLSRIFHDLSESGLIAVKSRHVQIPDADRLVAYQVAEGANAPSQDRPAAAKRTRTQAKAG